MRIMKTGEPCPCCGQAIPAMLPVDKRLLASIVAEGLAIQDAVRTVEHGVVEGQEAMTALTPPNEPLSLEQLREMDGEPVWVVYDQDAIKTTPGFDPLTLWALVEVTKNSIFLTNNLGGRTAYADDQDLEWAGITVYRRPPEGGD